MSPEDQALIDAEVWQNGTKPDLEKVKILLQREITQHRPQIIPRKCETLPLLHHGKDIELQFNGWCIHLNASGHWTYYDTTGG